MLANVIRLFEPLMAVLGLVWLLLLVLEFADRLPSGAARVGRAIWIVFVLDFAAELLIAPNRARYLRRQWLVALSLHSPLSASWARSGSRASLGSPALYAACD
jgi:hypothetical protein